MGSNVIDIENLRFFIREVLHQDLDPAGHSVTRSRLNPEQTKLALLSAPDLRQDYLLWTRVNGYNPDDPDVLAKYASEKKSEPAVKMFR